MLKAFQIVRWTKEQLSVIKLGRPTWLASLASYVGIESETRREVERDLFFCWFAINMS